MELFPIMLPKSHICRETALYYREKGAVRCDEKTGTLTLARNAVVCFDTYFNGFSYAKYLRYTRAKVLEVRVRVRGRVELRLMRATAGGRGVARRQLFSRRFACRTLEEVSFRYDFSRETGEGILYLEVAARSGDAVFAGGSFSTPFPEGARNPVRVAAVICTYHREESVKRNLRLLREEILDTGDAAAEGLEVLVVDNGRTLSREEVESPRIRLFPNKNYGGSGGFARGILEALRSRESFTHVLLMDDDILLDGRVLRKTIRFLQVLRPEEADLALGGSMLRLDAMRIQHEAGGRWTGYRILHGNHNLDLADLKAVLQNESLPQPQYNAWWYCCLPLCRIDSENLPLPFFIKADDIEYGMRLFRKWLILNGVGVWHEPFEGKQTPLLDYYDVRNKMILNTLCAERVLRKNLFLLLRTVGKHLLKGDPRMRSFAEAGCRDYLKGSAWLDALDAEAEQHFLEEEYSRLQGEGRRCAAREWISAGFRYGLLAVRLICGARRLRADYRANKRVLSSMARWRQRLDC